ncbi:MAG: exopolysaccharide biosynthesis polyprenyl glycosylphosphotransferase [Formivibrio sp.]|nr:exopolysaccharide biosynthesis polyprenyl glycosylphosphotransferase [Formivibrio sp.]
MKQAFKPADDLRGKPPQLISISAVPTESEAAAVNSHNLLERDLHSPLQTVADVAFVVGLGLLVGALYNDILQGIFHFGAEQFWCAITIALLYGVIERARVADNGIALTSRRARVVDVAKVWAMSFTGLVFINFALHTNTGLSRGFLGLYFIAGFFTFTLWRAFLPPSIARISHRFQRARTDLVVVGERTSGSLRKLAEELNANNAAVCTVISLDGHCCDELWPNEQQIVLSMACRALRSSHKGALYVCSAGLTPRRMDSLCSTLSILPVYTYIVPDNATVGLVGCKPVMVGRHIALELRRAQMGTIQILAKRILDVALGLIALLLLSPLFLAVSIAIRADSRGPVFFRQYRTGKGGKPFRIVKFRSMYVMEDGPTIQQARRNDPRVTRIGRYLRASSIDELPQLLNVLRGEMSLVGPRPHAVAHDRQYIDLVDNYELRQHVKPGITGWAQIHGLRGETADVNAMHRRIEHDIWYALNAGLLLDVEILARTVIELFRSRNAY